MSPSGAPGPREEWVAEFPGLKDGWRFRHAPVDGQWRDRPRLTEGEIATYTMAGLAGADHHPEDCKGLFFC